jgi:hypothetical protein
MSEIMRVYVFVSDKDPDILGFAAAPVFWTVG